ncbi:hypothetical protein MLD38_011182 [Melastoma candidum]|uniref:Uncharacterized protein n=1 Tax=Melastoma candidum TaxID=119954 RepID=A0ACB9R2S5_9MYRT|nr:hypothetical protein MLD38_011182 [Melastoma candidum]
MLVFEIAMTFEMVYTVYATSVDPRSGNIGIIALISIGLIVGVNILAGGAFDGSMTMSSSATSRTGRFRLQTSNK